MVLLGLAGRGPRSHEHARATGQMMNEMHPHYLAALTVTPVQGTVLYRQVQKGEFSILDPFETLEEMKIMMEAITVDPIKFVGSHASNYLPISGTLQKDKKDLLQKIEHVLDTRDTMYLRSDNLRGL